MHLSSRGLPYPGRTLSTLGRLPLSVYLGKGPLLLTGSNRLWLSFLPFHCPMLL